MSVSATTDRPAGNPSVLGPAFLVALLLHATALAGLALYAPTPSAPPGENTITIDLAPQMTEAESQAPADQAQSDPPPAVTETVEAPDALQSAAPPDAMAIAPEDTTTAMPTQAELTPPTEAVMEPPPQERIVTSTAEAAAPIEAPPEVVAEAPVPPEPVPPPEPVKPKEPDPAKLEAARQEAKRQAKLIAEREARRKAEIEARKEARAKAVKDAAREAARRDARPNTARGAVDSTSASRQASTGSAAGGTDPNALRAWQGALSSAIHGRMNRNAAAGTAGGVAVVRFTVSRSGQVLNAGLASSSGIGQIDSAALAAVRGTLPAAPAGVTASSLAVTVPLRFSPGR